MDEENLFTWTGVIGFAFAAIALLFSLSGSVQYYFNETQFLTNETNVSINESWLSSFSGGGQDLSEYGKDEFCYYREFTNFGASSIGTAQFNSYQATVLNSGGFVASNVINHYINKPQLYLDTVKSMYARSRAGTSTNSGVGLIAGIGSNPVSNGTLLTYRTALIFHQTVGYQINNVSAAENVFGQLGWGVNLGGANQNQANLDCNFIIDDGVIVGRTRHATGGTKSTSTITSKGATPDYGFDEWLVFEINRNITAQTAQFIIRNMSGSVLLNETIDDLNEGLITTYGAKLIAKPIVAMAAHIAGINFLDMQYKNKLNRFGLC